MTASLVSNLLQVVLLALMIGLVLRWFVTDIHRSRERDRREVSQEAREVSQEARGVRQEAREVRDETRDDAAAIRQHDRADRLELRQLEQQGRDRSDAHVYPLSEEDPETLARKGIGE